MRGFEILSLSNLGILLYSINFIIALIIIFLERREPDSVLAWIMILFLVPVAGLVVYFLFSQNISRQRIFRLTKSEEIAINHNLQEQITQIQNGSFSFVNPEARKWRDMVFLHQRYSKSLLSQDNAISIITDGQKMFKALLEDIYAAEKRVNVEFYIVKNDGAGKALLRALTEKAAAGLDVRLLMDSFGGRYFKAEDLRHYRAARGKLAFFFQPKLKIFSRKWNYRNHRKLVTIDDKIGYLGGFNIGNEYLGKVERFGYWRDTHLRVRGSCVQDMNARFMRDWRIASAERTSVAGVYSHAGPAEGDTAIQIVASGPDTLLEEVKHGYLKMIFSARKNIYIQTPYFVPDASIMGALKTAALSGIDVRIMIPRMPDHMFVYWATYAYVGELLDAGAKIYIYGNGFLHAKTICVDGEVASVGSANFDIRSFRLNFEGNAFIYSAEEARKLEAIFEDDMSRSSELTKSQYRGRSTLIKFKEGVSRLLSRVL
jgi:cardiolipin synthase